jgi:hypothetical protein
MQLKRYRIKICKIAYDKCFILVYDKANIARSKSCKAKGGMRDVNCNRSLNIHWGIAPLVAQLLKSSDVVHRFIKVVKEKMSV